MLSGDARVGAREGRQTTLSSFKHAMAENNLICLVHFTIFRPFLIASTQQKPRGIKNAFFVLIITCLKISSFINVYYQICSILKTGHPTVHIWDEMFNVGQKNDSFSTYLHDKCINQLGVCQPDEMCNVQKAEVEKGKHLLQRSHQTTGDRSQTEFLHPRQLLWLSYQ